MACGDEASSRDEKSGRKQQGYKSVRILSRAKRDLGRWADGLVLFIPLGMGDGVFPWRLRKAGLFRMI